MWENASRSYTIIFLYLWFYTFCTLPSDTFFRAVTKSLSLFYEYETMVEKYIYMRGIFRFLYFYFICLIWFPSVSKKFIFYSFRLDFLYRWRDCGRNFAQNWIGFQGFQTILRAHSLRLCPKMMSRLKVGILIKLRLQKPYKFRDNEEGWIQKSNFVVKSFKSRTFVPLTFPLKRLETYWEAISKTP